MSWDEVQQTAAFGLTVVGLIVVFGPLLAERLRLPGLLGLLFGGALIGPNVLSVLPDFGTLEAVGSIGVLYLIFLAGLQLDIDSFLTNRKVSAGFGLLTASIPMALGTAVALWLDFDVAAAVLIGSFWASFTLVTYPTVRALGLTKNRAVSAILGASSITDTISLVVLALVIGAETGDTTGWRLVVSIAVGLAIVVLWCFVIYPAIAVAFFTGVGQERTLRYMMVLIGLTSSAVLADLVSIEPLVAAFFVGVGLNRLVPNASPLMAVTDFFGNAFFIPTFLVSVGLLFDPDVMFERGTIELALWFLVALLVGKAFAAWLSGRLFALAKAEIGLMFSMSVAQAAATLAATIVGLEAGLYGDDVVNAVMVVVAVSLIVSSVGTSRVAPHVLPPVAERRLPGDAVLISTTQVADADLTRVAQLAGRLAEPAGGALQPVVVATSTAPDRVEWARCEARRADAVLSSAGFDVETQLRLDRSVGAALHRTAIQSDSSLLVLTWNGEHDLHDYLFGADYSEIIAATSVPVLVAALHDDVDLHHPGLVLFAADLSSARIPSLQLASDVVRSLSRPRTAASLGPAGLEAIAALGVELPPTLREVGNGSDSDDLVDWVRSHTAPGDVVVLPFTGTSMRSDAAQVYADGRSILAVSHNFEAHSALNSSTLSLPIGGTLNPS